MMYASKIKVNYEPQKIRYQREVRLPSGLLTLEDLGKYLKEGEKFSFFQREEGGIGIPVDYISIYGYRIETDEEVKVRVAKEEKYNENYEKFHAKYRK